MDMDISLAAMGMFLLIFGIANLLAMNSQTHDEQSKH